MEASRIVIRDPESSLQAVRDSQQPPAEASIPAAARNLVRYARGAFVIACCLLIGWRAGAGRPSAAADPMDSPPLAELTLSLSKGEGSGVRSTFTVSGILRDPDGQPVANVWIGLSSSGKWSEMTTGSDGLYSLLANESDYLEFYIQPPTSTHLAQRDIYEEGDFHADLTRDFDLLAGFRLAGEFKSPQGASTYLPWGADVYPAHPLAPGETFSIWCNWRNGTFEVVLPPDAYSILVYDPPRPYAPSRFTVDLRSGDVISAVYTLRASPEPLPGVEPPVAALIAVGAPDPDGNVALTGAAGAVAPFASVVAAHLTSGRWAQTVAGADGSFSLSLYGPPGSTLIVKQDPTHRYVNDFARYAVPDPTYSHPVGASNLEPLAGTTMYVPNLTPLSRHAGREQSFEESGEATFLPLSPSPSLPLSLSPFLPFSSWPLVASGIVNPYEGIATWQATAEVGLAGTMQRVYSGTLNGVAEPGLYLGGIHWGKPALVDLENDGNLDLYVGEDSGFIYQYRNAGQQERLAPSLDLLDPIGRPIRRVFNVAFSSPRWSFTADRWENMDISWWATPAFVDIDYDGDKDLISGTGDGKLTFFRNIGTPTTPAWRFVTSSYADIDVGDDSVPAFADSDADGDYDLFIGNSAGRIVFYRNIGTREEAVWMFVTSDYLGMGVGWLALPALADIDADGDLDLFVGTGGRIYFWRNDGTSQTPAWTLVSSRYAGIYEQGSGLWPVFADLDRDGDLDMLLSWDYGPIRTYTNFGTPAAPLWARTVEDTLPLDFGGYTVPALGDIDADGDLDLLVGDYHSRVHILRNDGPGWQESTLYVTDLGLVDAVDPNTLYFAAPALADIDGDGDLDLFVGEDDGTVDFIANRGTATHPNWMLAAVDYQGFDVGTHAKPTFGDLDGDGDLDLLLGAANGCLYFYRNTGTRTAPAWAAPVACYAGIDVGSYAAPDLADLDGDGDLDLLVGTHDSPIWAYRNDAGVFSLWTQSFGAARPYYYSAPALGDLSGDGRPDLVAGSLAGGLQLYLDRGDLGGLLSLRGAGSAVARDTEIASQTTLAMTDPTRLQPGDALVARGTLRVTSTALPPDFDPDTAYLGGNLALIPFFDAAGRPHTADSQYRSSLLTPTGFAVERYGSWYNRWSTYFEMTNKRLADPHTLEADFEVTLYPPTDLPTGWYRPVVEFYFDDIPGATGETVAYVFTGNRSNNQVFGPLLAVGEPAAPHLDWLLLADTFSNATRGTATDDAAVRLANRRIFQSDTLFVPRADARSGEPITYRLEPFDPWVSISDHSLPNESLIPFVFPSGQLHVVVQQQDGAVDDLGSAAFAQSASRTPVLLNGDLSEGCSGSVMSIYQLVTNSGQFDYRFTQDGLHVITMTGTIQDVWGQTYTGGGTYRVQVGREIHIHPGSVPGTPFQVGDTLAPTVRLSPAVPAEVTIRARLYRNSDPTDVLERVVTGQANRFGYFDGDGLAFQLDAAGEYRVDVIAVYTDGDGVGWVGSQSWGNVVETPATRLVGHGRRGIDESYTRTQWFTRRATGVEGGHLNFPFASGDVAWATDGDGSAAKVTFHDPDGTFAQVVAERAALSYPVYDGPGNLANRIAVGETPLFSIARGPSDPAYTLNPPEQLGYTYRVAQRPGLSVHQQVTEDTSYAPIWRFGNRHSSQIGMGMDGEMTNDFKWHFGGVVLRDLVEGWNQYAIYSSFWVDLPGYDPIGSRVFPPFQGAAGGPSGGPLFTVKGQPIDLFIEPTGVRPGAVLEVGDRFVFAGQLAPPLASRVAATVTAPGGATHAINGRANKVGYFYQPAADFVVDQPGVWSVQVVVTADGMTSAGPVDPPYPTGNVLGSEAGRYYFYVVEPAQNRAAITWPTPGWAAFTNGWDIAKQTISVPVPQGWTDARLRYTIAMPGWILDSREITPTKNSFQIVYDPKTLSYTFPNLDQRRAQSWSPGLSDEVFISFVVSGNADGAAAHQANVVTLQGEQLRYEGYQPPIPITVTVTPEPVPTPVGARSSRAGVSAPAEGDHRSFLSLILGAGQSQSVARPPWCLNPASGDCAPPPRSTPVAPEYEMANPNQDVGRVR